jgi:thiol-disulfide isomerase/thioredoxin
MFGQPAPPVKVTRWLNAPDHTQIDLADGHVTLLEFSSWSCHGCKFTYRPLDTLAQEWAGRGFRVVLNVAFDDVADQAADHREQWRNFFKEYGVRYPVALEKAPERVSALYPTYAEPTMVLIDGHGIIRDIWQGWQGNDNLRRRVDLILRRQESESVQKSVASRI